MHLTSKLSHPNVVGLLAHATTGAGTLAVASGGAAALDPEVVGSPMSWGGAGRANGHADHMARVSLDGVPREEARLPLKSTGIEVYSAFDMDASRLAACRARRRAPPESTRLQVYSFKFICVGIVWFLGPGIVCLNCEAPVMGLNVNPLLAGCGHRECCACRRPSPGFCARAGVAAAGVLRPRHSGGQRRSRPVLQRAHNNSKALG